MSLLAMDEQGRFAAGMGGVLMLVPVRICVAGVTD
jgi:hypothetical protein